MGESLRLIVLATVNLSQDWVMKSMTFLQSGNALSGAFPSPRDETRGLPVWALAVVVASAGVTLIWLMAIVLLVRVIQSMIQATLFNNAMNLGGISGVQWSIRGEQ